MKTVDLFAFVEVKEPEPGIFVGLYSYMLKYNRMGKMAYGGFLLDREIPSEESLSVLATQVAVNVEKWLNEECRIVVHSNVPIPATGPHTWEQREDRLWEGVSYKVENIPYMIGHIEIDLNGENV